MPFKELRLYLAVRYARNGNNTLTTEFPVYNSTVKIHLLPFNIRAMNIAEYRNVLTAPFQRKGNRERIGVRTCKVPVLGHELKRRAFLYVGWLAINNYLHIIFLI